MVTTPQEPAGADGGGDPGETTDPTSALEQSVGVELGMTEEPNTFEPEEDTQS